MLSNDLNPVITTFEEITTLLLSCGVTENHRCSSSRCTRRAQSSQRRCSSRPERHQRASQCSSAYSEQGPTRFSAPHSSVAVVLTMFLIPASPDVPPCVHFRICCSVFIIRLLTKCFFSFDSFSTISFEKRQICFPDLGFPVFQKYSDRFSTESGRFTISGDLHKKQLGFPFP